MLAAGPCGQPCFQRANLWPHDIGPMVKHLLPPGLDFFADTRLLGFQINKGDIHHGGGLGSGGGGSSGGVNIDKLGLHRLKYFLHAKRLTNMGGGWPAAFTAIDKGAHFVF